MNIVEKLIIEKCPKGVEQKTLGEIGTLIRGNGLRKKDFTENGIGCIHYGQIYTHYGTFTDKTKSFIPPELARKLKKVNKGDLLIASTSEDIEGICKAVAWLGDDEIVAGGDATILKHSQNPKYISYYFQTPMFFDQKRKFARGTKVIHISAKDMAKILIPLPPLDIQEQIVIFLDKFTELEMELQAELQAELEARKKQYEHYRGELLTFGDDVERMTLEEITSSLKTGLNPRKKFVLNPPNAENYYVTVRELGGIEINFVKSTDKVNDEAIKLINNRSNLEQGDVLFSGTGTVGRTALVKEKPENWNIKEGIYAIKPNQKIIDSKFLLFYLNSPHAKEEYEKKIVGSLVMSVPMRDLKKIKVPTPEMLEQKRIVSVLDKFDALVNDISISLPAELKARRKQYEYYRDKLLTFNEYAS